MPCRTILQFWGCIVINSNDSPCHCKILQATVTPPSRRDSRTRTWNRTTEGIMSDDQLQADSANLQEFNLSSVLNVLSIFIVLILRFRLDFRLMAPAQSCSEETFRQSGTWSTARAGTARHRSWCPRLESHPSKGGKDVS